MGNTLNFADLQADWSPRIPTSSELWEMDDRSPFGHFGFSDERLLAILIHAACPAPCNRELDADGKPAGWHKACEAKALAAMAVLRPNHHVAKGSPPESTDPNWHPYDPNKSCCTGGMTDGDF